MSGQQLFGVPSGSCMQSRSLCWLLQWLTRRAFPSECSLSVVVQVTLEVLFLAVVAGGDPVPFPCYVLRTLKCCS